MAEAEQQGAGAVFVDLSDASALEAGDQVFVKAAAEAEAATIAAGLKFNPARSRRCGSRGTVVSADDGANSRRRDWHSAAPPSTLSRCFNTDGEGVSAK